MDGEQQPGKQRSFRLDHSRVEGNEDDHNDDDDGYEADDVVITTARRGG